MGSTSANDAGRRLRSGETWFALVVDAQEFDLELKI